MACEFCLNYSDEIRKTVMNYLDVRAHYCPVCGERLDAVDFYNIVKTLADACTHRNTVVCDGEVLEFDSSEKSPWSYDGSTKTLELDKVDISREIEILNNYAREHGYEEDKFDV